MALTDAAVRSAKPKPGLKARKLFDGNGLYLLVQPNGAKYWRLKYRIAGKERLISLGTYPEVGLGQARRRRQDERALLRDGIDPSGARKALRASQRASDANTFEAIAREWLTRFSSTWSPVYREAVQKRLERNVFPVIGSRPIREVGVPELLGVVGRLEARGSIETAHKVLQHCGQVFRHAMRTERTDRDPSAALRGSLPPVKRVHLPAVTEPESVSELLRAIDEYKGRGAPIVASGLRLLPLLFVRPGELRRATWSEIDWEREQWMIPADRMKMRQPHLVPLSRQALSILRELHRASGSGQYVFPGRANRPLSENAFTTALGAMGFKGAMTAHGFRAMARTLLHERLAFAPDIIEHQLAHAVPDRLGTAYNRTRFLEERRAMMQRWADYLDELKKPALRLLPGACSMAPNSEAASEQLRT